MTNTSFIYIMTTNKQHHTLQVFAASNKFMPRIVGIIHDLVQFSASQILSIVTYIEMSTLQVFEKIYISLSRWFNMVKDLF